MAIVGYFTLAKISIPISECVECINGKTWDNKPCCNFSFEFKCSLANGVVRTSDLHPLLSTVLKGCYLKAPDTGKKCSGGQDCWSGICDLESAIKSKKCTLIKKELTGEKNRFGGDEFYTASYSCDSLNPGICTATIENNVNPGGKSHFFEMDGETLTETLTSGPIN